MRPAETRYARSGDVHIAYQVTGDGPFDLVYVPPFVSHVELQWQVPSGVALIERLSSFARLIRFDKRGTGMSDRVEGVPTLETRMDDVRAVMDSAGSEKAAVLGASEGGPMSALFAATYPDRCWALILFGTIASERPAPDYPWGDSDEEFRAELDWAEDWGSIQHAASLAEALAPTSSEDEKAALATMIRQSASPGAAVALTRMNRESDVRGILGAIRVPTLVLNRIGDHPHIVGGSQYLAQHIPPAEHIEFPGVEHAISAGNTVAVLDEIERFLRASWDTHLHEESEPERVLSTVLFTDIVGSTAKAAELGDRGWRELLSEHHTVIRRELARGRGRELDTAGDGFFASFDGPARAIRCASRISEEVKQLGIDIRAGLHTGECEVIDGKVGGIAVHIGARVASQAGPGEVLVSSTVKDLVAGAGIEFSDRGAVELKGVPGEWRLFAVERA
ncbi:MAG: adenylate/guanylate cyclase domain-containing protein [Actinobacteria bacterium]|nr:MAG: adenylate/guanylate cyclase domain-containing protein [Actinomycetota bacterium]